ncbi:MAG: type II secretion system F family protein [Candidatus Colwellbacteria bacterium]|nr:type II secretion system F family protein [Candidatus Colwellbacteria bacterium]
MRFQYIASNLEGKIVEGNLEAESPAAVLDWMAEKGLKPVSIKAVGKAGLGEKWYEKLLPGKQAISIEDKVFLTKYLALMLRVGADLFRAIDILIADLEKPAMKNFLVEIKDNLGKGQPFYVTFTRYPKYFSAVFVSLIKAGESSGNLQEVFEILNVNLEKEKELRGKIKSALTYPLVLVGISFLVLYLMLTITLPKIAKTFLSGGTEIPTFSKIVFSVGLFLGKYTIIIGPAIILGSIGTWLFFSKTLAGRRALERILHKTPVIKDILFKLALQRFTSTMASLLRSGTLILEAIETTADAAGSTEVKAALLRISREGISKGLTVGEAFRKEPIFPRVVVNLIAISEKSGHMEEVLETLANFYSSESDSSLKTLVSLLEPALLVFIGIVVAVIALSIIVPVLQLVRQI